MIQRLKIFGALIFAAAFVSNAHAGLLIEPYLGYHLGKYERSGTYERDQSGLSLGGRLGYQHTLGPMLGVDFQTGMWSDDANPKNDLTPTNISLFAGFEFPIMLRVYAAYGLKNEL